MLLTVLPFIISCLILACSGDQQTLSESENKPVETLRGKYAENFSVEVFNGYKKVTVKNPWSRAKKDFSYILTSRGSDAQIPDTDLPVIFTPVEKIIIFSTVYLPLIDSLGGIDKIKAVADAGHVNNPHLREKLDRGVLPQVKSGGNINYETIMEIQPDVLFSFAVGDPQYDSHGQLISRGIPVVLMSSYMESSPLGRAEWIKFIALFLEQDSLAQKNFHRVDSAYQMLSSKAASVKKRPGVFSGAVFGGSWHVPGGKSFTARLFGDAGADYLWKHNKKRGGVALSFEAVYEKASETEFWLHPSNWQRLESGLEQDKRYQLFRAFKTGKIFNNNARLNDFGGNDFYETGSASPHLVLRDLIEIFHPDILPGDSLYYYRRLNQ